VPAFVLRRWRSDAERATAGEPNGAFTRWRVAAAPSELSPVPGLAPARWRLNLLRCRGAEPREWIVESCDAEGRLRLPPLLADRPNPEEFRTAGVGSVGPVPGRRAIA
jgi:protein ImuA